MRCGFLRTQCLVEVSHSRSEVIVTTENFQTPSQECRELVPNVVLSCGHVQTRLACYIAQAPDAVQCLRNRDMTLKKAVNTVDARRSNSLLEYIIFSGALLRRAPRYSLPSSPILTLDLASRKKHQKLSSAPWRRLDIELLLSIVKDLRSFQFAATPRRPYLKSPPLDSQTSKTCCSQHFAAVSTSTRQSDLARPGLFTPSKNHRCSQHIYKTKRSCTPCTLLQSALPCRQHFPAGSTSTRQSDLARPGLFTLSKNYRSRQGILSLIISIDQKCPHDTVRTRFLFENLCSL